MCPNVFTGNKTKPYVIVKPIGIPYLQIYIFIRFGAFIFVDIRIINIFTDSTVVIFEYIFFFLGTFVVDMFLTKLWSGVNERIEEKCYVTSQQKIGYPTIVSTSTV